MVKITNFALSRGGKNNVIESLADEFFFHFVGKNLCQLLEFIYRVSKFIYLLIIGIYLLSVNQFILNLHLFNNCNLFTYLSSIQSYLFLYLSIIEIYLLIYLFINY